MRFRLRLDFMRAIWVIMAVIVLVLIAFKVVEKEQQNQEELPPATYITIVNQDGENEQIELELFVMGVVAAEMPASFEEEALKAQAIAARTYILSHCEPYGQPRHGEAAVCCDSTHCQAYADELELRMRWGKNYDKYYAKIADAVLATRGEILFWQESIAQTPFCSTCGGRTENAEACWGQAFPYLVAVDCDYCSHSPKYSSYQRFSLAETASLLATDIDKLYSMQVETYTPGDRIGTLSIEDMLYKGTEMRSKLGLNSAAFNWLIIGDNIVFTTIGYGHGVGMCQYGADGMAQRGYDYQQILQKYYPGTTIHQEGS